MVSLFPPLLVYVQDSLEAAGVALSCTHRCYYSLYRLDFIIRLFSVAVKAVVAVVKADSLIWLRSNNNNSERGVSVPVTSPRSPSAGFGVADPYMHAIDLESQPLAPAESQPRAPSSITFYRRKVRTIHFSYVKRAFFCLQVL